MPEPVPSELTAFDTDTASGLLRMLEEWERLTESSVDETKQQMVSNGVYLCRPASELAAYGGSGSLPFTDAAMWKIVPAALPSTNRTLSAILKPGAVSFTQRVYNPLGVSFPANEYLLAVPLKHGYYVAIGGSGSGGSGACRCACIDTGDMFVNGILTTSKWTVTFQKSQKRKQANGWIELPAGAYTITWSSARVLWVLDVGGYLSSYYSDGSDATSATTMDGELTMEWAALGSRPKVKLCITGTVPPKP